jgi:hypothetical protein
MSRPPFSEWLFNPREPSLLPWASSLYNSFPLHMVLLSLLSYMSYPAQHETQPHKIHSATHSSQGVCYWYSPQQTLCRSKEWSQKVLEQKDEEEDEVMARMIIISFKQKLKSLFQRRVWCWKDWTSWIRCLRKLSSRAGSTNSWMNDISLKIRVVSQWEKSLKRMWQDDFRHIRNGRQHSWFGSCQNKENQIRSLMSAGSKMNAVEWARLAQHQGIASA